MSEDGKNDFSADSVEQPQDTESTSTQSVTAATSGETGEDEYKKVLQHADVSEDPESEIRPGLDRTETEATAVNEEDEFESGEILGTRDDGSGLRDWPSRYKTHTSTTLDGIEAAVEDPAFYDSDGKADKDDKHSQGEPGEESARESGPPESESENPFSRALQRAPTLAVGTQADPKDDMEEGAGGSEPHADDD